MIKKDFKNIQVQARPELYDLFQDTFEQSGSNSKGEFLGVLLETYLNPDHESVVKKLQSSFDKERENFVREKQNLIDQANQNQKETFSPAIMDFYKPILDKVKGQTVKFPDRKTNELKVLEVNTVEDVINIILNSIEIQL